MNDGSTKSSVSGGTVSPNETTASYAPTILIVDDNTEMTEITKLLIEKHTNIKVLTAFSGKEALETLQEEAVDTIILDMNMPDMTGSECFRIIRKRSIYVPVIFLTGKVSDECKNDQLALGAFDYIEKPIKAKDLIILLKDAIAAMERIRSLLIRPNSSSSQNQAS